MARPRCRDVDGRRRGDAHRAQRHRERHRRKLDRAKDNHFDKATIAEKGKLEGIQMAVQGGFQRAGKPVRITARFVRVENGEIVDNVTVTRPAATCSARRTRSRAGSSRSWWRWRRWRRPRNDLADTHVGHDGGRHAVQGSVGRQGPGRRGDPRDGHVRLKDPGLKVVERGNIDDPRRAEPAGQRRPTSIRCRR